MSHWLTKPSIDWLAVFLPVAIGLEIAHAAFHAPWATPTLIFIASCLAIIPVAGWMGHATEHLAARLGEGVGGLLNATFGNAAELIIALMALIEGARHPEKTAAMHNIVKASLTGSIIGNVLLVLGLALLAGGIRFSILKFNVTAARLGSTLLRLSVVALLVPALFGFLVSPADDGAADISFEIAIALLVVYALSLLFSLRTHQHLYAGDAHPEPDGRPDHAVHATWSLKRALGTLLGATVLIAIVAEILVGSVEAASRAIGLSELFVGVIVVAIVGNAAEHSTAILVALRNRMDLSLSIAIGSSIQIALFVAPAVVLISYALGTPMNLIFTLPEVVAIAIAVSIMGQIAGDGESHWLEGVLLLTVYLFLGFLFFHLPG
ncbi:MAG: Ca(2+)/H(+) antiporter [Phycisphaerae bacterium]|nr:Ca(2+)/H(+) antiporter [Phycisphaerae bacterium]